MHSLMIQHRQVLNWYPWMIGAYVPDYLPQAAPGDPELVSVLFQNFAKQFNRPAE